MTAYDDSTITPAAIRFIAEKFHARSVTTQPVSGGYSRNRRALITAGQASLFAKEVDISLLPDDGTTELGWLQKDYNIITGLSRHGVIITPEWAELHMDGHLLLLPSYKQADGWHWTVPHDEPTRTEYIQAVIDATKQLESTTLPDELTEKLSLQPFFRDELADDAGIAPLFEDMALREKLIQTYTALLARGDYLAPAYSDMLTTLKDDMQLRGLMQRTKRLKNLANDSLNHCDVRSDNIAFSERTGEVKFVDWNWASYAPKRFGATEFLLDMARRGVDTSPWHDDMSVDLLAACVGFYMIRSLKPLLIPGNTLRDMQAETAAVANHLYRQLR